MVCRFISVLILFFYTQTTGELVFSCSLNYKLPYEVKVESSINAPGYDAVIFISSEKPGTDGPEPIKSALADLYKIDKNLENEIAVLPVNLPAERLVYIPVSINLDFNDVRSFGEAGHKGILRALKAGSKSPLVVLTCYKEFPYTQLVTVLGVLEALYVKLQYREDQPEVFPKLKSLGFYSPNSKNLPTVIDNAKILEHGRWIARDIGGADPERMTPRRVEEYVLDALEDPSLSIHVISDLATLQKEFPLFAAVNRAANEIERHRGRIIFITYESGTPKESLFLVGKGITYDTGGADIKAGGIMAGMSRDKCGAAAVAGFMKIISALKPTDVKVVGILSLTRNSVGENSYVSDEMIVSRAGRRIRACNTDAEGRMIMADVLCYAKEEALKSVNPHLLTIATLTGHAWLLTGDGYAVVVDNAVARKEENAPILQKVSELIGDPFEQTTLRREDYSFHSGKAEGEDAVQASTQLSSKIPRGHQGPVAFLILASGLDEYGVSSKTPIKYSHLDITASAGEVPEEATGSPILALYAKFFNSYFNKLQD